MWQAVVLALVEWWRQNWTLVASFLAGVKVAKDAQIKQERDALGRYIAARPITDGMSRLEKLAWLRRRGLLRDDGADVRERE